jgi:hypothetical protein
MSSLSPEGWTVVVSIFDALNFVLIGVTALLVRKALGEPELRRYGQWRVLGAAIGLPTLKKTDGLYHASIGRLRRRLVCIPLFFCIFLVGDQFLRMREEHAAQQWLDGHGYSTRVVAPHQR